MQEDAPPPRSTAAFLAIIAIAAAWPAAQRIPGAQPYQGNKLPPSVLAVPEDNPPFSSRDLGGQVRSWYGQTAWQQQLPRKLVPIDAGFVPSARQSWWISRAQADWSLPTRRLLPPAILAVPEDNPPFGLKPPLWSVAPAWPAQSQRPIAALLQTAAADNPPFGVRLQPLAPAPVWWPAQSAPRSLPDSVDDPPRVGFSPLAAILRQWMPPPSWPSQAFKLAPSITAVAEDNPPLGLRDGVALRAWNTLPPPIVRLQFVVQDGTVAPAFVPFTRQSLWQQAPVAPFVQRRLLPPSLIAVPEDNPPFGVKPQSWNVAAAVTWSVQPRQLLTPPSVDNPPFGLRKRALDAPAPSWFAQAAPRLPAQAVVQVDNPPFAARRLVDVSTHWQQVWPQTPRRALQVQPGAAVAASYVDVAYETLRAWLIANWSATALRFENETLDPPAALAAFVFFEVWSEFVDVAEIGAGNPHDAVWREEGEAVFHIVVASGSGALQVRDYAEQLALKLRGLILANGVRIGALSIGSGEQLAGDGGYFDLPLSAQWARDNWVLGSN